MRLLLALFAVLTMSAHATPTARLKLKYLEGHRPVPPPGARLLRSLPFYLDGPAELLRFRYDEYGVDSIPAPQQPPSFDKAQTEVRTLVTSGPKENRVNLTILGDGYTVSEKDKFFADA